MAFTCSTSPILKLKAVYYLEPESTGCHKKTPCQLALPPWQQSGESILPPEYAGSRQAVPTSRVWVCVCACGEKGGLKTGTLAWAASALTTELCTSRKHKSCMWQSQMSITALSISILLSSLKCCSTLVKGEAHYMLTRRHTHASIPSTFNGAQMARTEWLLRCIKRVL